MEGLKWHEISFIAKWWAFNHRFFMYMWWLYFLQFCLVCATASSFDRAERWLQWAMLTDVRLLQVLCDRGQGSEVWRFPHPSATQLSAGGWKWWIKQLLCDLFWETSFSLPSLKNWKELGKMHPSRVAKVPSCPGRAPVALVLGHCHVPSIEYFLRGRPCRFRSTLPLKLVLGPSLSIFHCVP